MKKFKLMLIDDQYDMRRSAYENIFSSENFELIPVKSYLNLQQIAQETPVDGYVVDIFLDTQDWSEIGTASALFSKDLKTPPRKAPVFLVSDKWGNSEATEVLTVVNQQKNIDVLRYLAFEEFTKALTDQNHQKNGIFVDAVIVLRKKIIDDLSKWHELSSYQLKEDQTIRILLLADLQYTDPHTDKSAKFDELLIGKALNKKKLVPDFIVLAGDISFTGAPNEFRLAKDKIESLAEFMWNKKLDEVRERIIVVPGNHDVNLRIAACDKYKWHRDNKEWILNSTVSQEKATNSHDDEIIYSSHMDFALEPFRQFARRITGSRMWDDAQCLCKVDRRFEHLGIRFFLFNSVANLSIDEPQKADFNETALNKIFKELGVDDNPDSLYNMAISHHGILSSDTKQIQMKNWNAAGKQFFKEHKIRLWMFGHYHKHLTRTFDEEAFENENLKIIQAATLKINSDSERGFSLIELDRKGGLVTTVKEYFFKLNENGCELKNSEPKVLFTAPENNSPVG